VGSMGNPNASSDPALDSIDQFVTVAGRLADLPALRHPPLREVAAGLHEVALLLLDANENPTGWLYQFRNFTFRGADPEHRFGVLTERYARAKAGRELHAMKFHCGHIRTLYHEHVDGRLSELYPDDETARSAVRETFDDLGNADADMVRLIYDTVVANIDSFVADADAAVDRRDLNAAEKRRLRFKVETADLAGRADHAGAALSDLALRFAHLSGRPVITPAGAAERRP
jgi:hypothetical protein